MHKCSKGMHRGSEWFFERWASLIINCSVPVFFIAILALGLMANSSLKDDEFKSNVDAYFINTLDDDFDKSLARVSKKTGFFPAEVKFIIEAKGDSILTLDAFEEMLEVFETISEQISESDEQCVPFYPAQRMGEKECARSANPVDFIYDAQTNSFDLTKFEKDTDLIDRIQQGTTEKELI